MYHNSPSSANSYEGCMYLLPSHTTEEEAAQFYRTVQHMTTGLACRAYGATRTHTHTRNPPWPMDDGDLPSYVTM